MQCCCRKFFELSLMLQLLVSLIFVEDMSWGSHQSVPGQYSTQLNILVTCFHCYTKNDTDEDTPRGYCRFSSCFFPSLLEISVFAMGFFSSGMHTLGVSGGM